MVAARTVLAPVQRASRAVLIALVMWMAMTGVGHAQLERLPPVVQGQPGESLEPRWAAGYTEWSQIARRGQNGVEILNEPDGAEMAPADPWTWQILPAGLIYRSYLAGVKESRFASVWNYTNKHQGVWDITLGGRVSVLRYGTANPLLPKGWEIQIEGAAQPRLRLNSDRDMQAADFRFGIPMAYSHGPWEYKFGYYHLSAHKGDEQMVKDNSLYRINYSRDCLVLGVAWRKTPDLRFYVDTAWAFYSDAGARPWEFQFGVDYSPLIPNGIKPLPFAALNGYLRQDVHYGGNFVAQTGIQWRGANTGHLLRFGVEYYNGFSRQFQFFNQWEQQIGLGIWFDY